MSREIKFRLWDGERYWYNVAPLNNEEALTQELTDGECEWEYNNQYAVRKGIIEQDTGLKDKNGERICEGDICRIAYYTKGKTHKRWHKKYEDVEKVDFEYGFFLFATPERNGIDSVLSFSDYGEWSEKDGSYKYEAEVIGNIHENPELLKEASCQS